ALWVPLLALSLVGTVVVAQAQARFSGDSVAARRWVYEKTQRGATDEAILYNVDSCEFINGVFGERRYYRMRSGKEFEETLARAAAQSNRIVVAETDHRYRRGPHYARPLIEAGRWGSFRVVASEDLGRIVLVLLERTA
ncbi:MAG: hypothetical protein KC729_21280, partial [Candidatus Eisenbacteria bacterium]|nr:hypothetical protein [Candidatus Eisenbacteria bacterium]